MHFKSYHLNMQCTISYEMVNSFFILNLQNPVCILYLGLISIWTGHIPSGPQLPCLWQDSTGWRGKIDSMLWHSLWRLAQILSQVPFLVCCPHHLFLLMLSVASKPLPKPSTCQWTSCPFAMTPSWLHRLWGPQLSPLSLLGQDFLDLFMQLITSCDVQTSCFPNYI